MQISRTYRKLFQSIVTATALTVTMAIPAAAAIGYGPLTQTPATQARYLGDVRIYSESLRTALGAAQPGIAGVLIEPGNFVRRTPVPAVPSGLMQEASLRLAPIAPAEKPKARPGNMKGIFDTVRIRVGNIPAAQRWQRIWTTISGCGTGAACARTEAGLRRVVGETEGKRFLDKLDAVNRGVNQAISYAPDAETYGRRDYWANVGEILAAGRGDCEDFAILKMAALARAGIPEESMSIVVVYVESKDVFHAILAVSTSKGTYVLDNVREDVYLDTSNPDYQPLYSLSTDRAWIHGTRVGSKQARNVVANFSDIAPGEGPLGAEQARTR